MWYHGTVIFRFARMSNGKGCNNTVRTVVRRCDVNKAVGVGYRVRSWILALRPRPNVSGWMGNF